jgi:hypothetical protein
MLLRAFASRSSHMIYVPLTLIFGEGINTVYWPSVLRPSASWILPTIYSALDLFHVTTAVVCISHLICE